MHPRVALHTLFVSSLLAQPGVITTIAGTGSATFSGDNGPGISAALSSPNGVGLDAAGNVYIADSLNFRVRKLDSSGTVKTVAGCGGPSVTCSIPPNFGEGAQATTVFLAGVWDVVTDAAGNFYYTDSGTNRIRKVNPSGVLSTYAGGGAMLGDGGPAVNAKLDNPVGLGIDSSGNIYVAEVNSHRVRKITAATGIITTIAGAGGSGAYAGDGGPATSARLYAPHGVTVDAAGNVYIADTTNYRIRKVAPNGTITTVAGNGKITLAGINPLGDGGAATSATMSAPWDVDVDADGNLYISDWLGYRVRKVDAGTGIITSIAGTGTSGFSGDGGPATSAAVSTPQGLAVDASGDVYFADNQNHRVRKINAPPLGAPSIRSTNYMLPAFMGQAGLASNMYAEIYGSNFARSARVWAASDFNGPNAPTTLNGVSVKVNNKPAFIYYASPTQININMPDDTATGPVELRIETPSGTIFANMTRTRLSPSLQSVPQFNIGGKQYVVALTTNFASYIGRPNMLAGVSFVAPKPGDTITIFALGLGPTDPPTSAGVAAAATGNVTLPLQLKIGGVTASVPFAGLVKDSIGLYQLNVVIPNVPAGDQPIEMSVDGVTNGQNLFIVVGQ